MTSSLNTPLVPSAWFSAVVNLVSRGTLVFFFYIIIMVVSLFGNYLVCKTALSRHTRSSTNYLIANLAISDMLMTLINIPITVLDILLGDWIFGQLMCWLVPFLQAVCVYVSSFSMLTIAIHRYYLVYHNKHPQPPVRPKSPGLEVSVNLADLSPASRRASDNTTSPTDRKQSAPSPVPSVCFSRNLCLLLVFLWLLAVVHSTPFAMHNQLVSVLTANSGLVRRCRLDDRRSFTELTLTLFAFFTQYLIPLVIAALIYLRIGFTISRLGLRPKQSCPSTCLTSSHTPSLLLVPSRPTTTTRSEAYSLRVCRREVLLHKRRRILLLALIVSIFALCWLPFHVYFLLKDFSLISSNGPVFLLCHWLAMSSVCYNPFVYFWLNEHFRTEARKLLMVLPECRLFKTTPNVTKGQVARNAYAEPVKYAAERSNSEESRFKPLDKPRPGTCNAAADLTPHAALHIPISRSN